MTPDELLQEAVEAMEYSYSPYSHFAVGAALLTKDGRVYNGANVENSSYGLSMCAERNAIYHALMEGCTGDDFLALAIVGDTEEPISPCGACRQAIAEFFPQDAEVYLGNRSGDRITMTVGELLPYAFEGGDMQ